MIWPNSASEDLPQPEGPTTSSAAHRGDIHTSHQLAQQLHQVWLARLGPDDHHNPLGGQPTLADIWRSFARYQLGRHEDARQLEADA